MRDYQPTKHNASRWISGTTRRFSLQRTDQQRARTRSPGALRKPGNAAADIWLFA
jgi:hypothetical protein